jgi:glycosyltransferase involved in cell wall biosynthesis
MKISVIMPVYNEEKFLLQSIARVRETSKDKEIIVVDDGSKDSTPKILKENAEKLNFQVFTHKKNSGKGAALRTGFKYASGEIIIINDADLEYDPKEHDKLVEPIIAGRADVVYGSRFKGGSAGRVLYFWHMLGNKLLTLFSNSCTNLCLTDMETCYKAFKASVLDGIRLRENRFGFEPEFTAKISKRRLRIYEVGISYNGRTYDEGKKINYIDGIRAIYCILRYNLFK